ncbi:MAG TPA: HlyD family secretion protein [Candidatus Megaira endosymbiont of Nemacystus decipiens]|nr:HlyD family secretion protein [Candidatus Megaera endosymbiont of Nemacystus decipiens]
MHLKEISLSNSKRVTKDFISRNTRNISLILFVFAIYIAYEVYVWSITQSTDNAYIEAEISDVSSEVNGAISEILVKENNHVIKDQPIAKIENTIYQAHLEKSYAALKSAEQNIETIKQNIRLTEIKHLKAVSLHKSAEESLMLIEKDFNRTDKLNQNSYASQKHLESARIHYINTKTKAEQTKFDVELSLENLKLLKIQLASAKIQYNAALADNVLAKKNLDDTVLRSPIDGIMTNSSLREGKFVQTGRILFSVVPVEEIYVKANFKETQVMHFKEGMQAEVYLDAFKGRKVMGNIRNIFPAAGAKFSLIPPQNASGNFTKIVQRIPVIIDLQVPEDLRGRIAPGMSCFVKIRT